MMLRVPSNDKEYDLTFVAVMTVLKLRKSK